MTATSLILLAWFLFFMGTQATTCTMCDIGSIAAGVFLSTPIYTIAWLFIIFRKPREFRQILSIMLLPVIAYQIYISLRITYAINIMHGCGCWAYKDYPLDIINKPSGFDLLIGPLLLTTASVTLSLIFWRWLIAPALRSRRASCTMPDESPAA